MRVSSNLMSAMMLSRISPPDPPTSCPTRMSPMTSVLSRRGLTMDNAPVLVVLRTLSSDSTDMLIPNARLQQNTVNELTTKCGEQAEKLKRAKLKLVT